jgi:high-affinity Fe2+/Pb2+ permease
MAEPVSSSFGLTKLILGIAGLFGGIAISIFWQPNKIKRLGMLSAGAVIGALSFGFSFALGGVLANAINVDLANPDNAMAVGVLIGAISVGVVSYVAKWLENREGKDIGEVIKDAKKDIKESL